MPPKYKSKEIVYENKPVAFFLFNTTTIIKISKNNNSNNKPSNNYNDFLLC